MLGINKLIGIRAIIVKGCRRAGNIIIEVKTIITDEIYKSPRILNIDTEGNQVTL
jgi:hypothetical protein